MRYRTPPARGGASWTPTEDRVLDLHWAEEPIEVTAGRLGRTPAALRARLRARGEGAALTQGRLTIEEVVRTTGYARSQVLRGIRLAHVRPLRTSRAARASVLLTEDQVSRVVAALAAEGGVPTVDALAASAGVTRRWLQRLARAAGINVASGGGRLDAERAAAIASLRPGGRDERRDRDRDADP